MSELSYLEKLLDGVEVEWKSLGEIATKIYSGGTPGNDSNLLIVFYVQIMPDDFVMQLHRF